MKKLLVLFLFVGALAITSVGCGDKSTSKPPGSGNAPTPKKDTTK